LTSELLIVHVNCQSTNVNVLSRELLIVSILPIAREGNKDAIMKYLGPKR
jgi:hypothetical protein